VQVPTAIKVTVVSETEHLVPVEVPKVTASPLDVVADKPKVPIPKVLLARAAKVIV